MQRICFVLRVKPDKLREYKERHRQVWPEMQAALRETGLNWCSARSKFCLWRRRPISPTVSFERALSEQVNLSAPMIYLLPLRGSLLGIPLLPITTTNLPESRTFAARTGCAEARSFSADISL